MTNENLSEKSKKDYFMNKASLLMQSKDIPEKFHELIIEMLTSIAEQEIKISHLEKILELSDETKNKLADECNRISEGWKTAFDESHKKVDEINKKYFDELQNSSSEYRDIALLIYEKYNSQLDVHYKLCIDYAEEKKKHSRGGKVGKKYANYEDEIKIALSRYLGATKAESINLNDVALEITNAISAKDGKCLEPSENQIITWKKAYIDSNRQSIYK